MRNTNKSYILLLILAIICCRTSVSAQKQFLVQSPDNELKVNISVGNTIEYSVSHNGDLMIANSPISMSLTNGKSFGINPRLAGLSSKTLNDTITASVYKRKEIADTYNELILRFKEGFSLVFRAYNDGIAYRFVSNLKKPFEVKSEEVNFNFPTDQKAYIPYVQIIK